MTTVIGVMSVFNPPSGLAERVQQLREQLDGVVLVDDGSASLHDFPDIAGVRCVVLAENGGIARALNVGVREALQLDATHLLFLDQDSDLPIGYVQRLLGAIEGRASDTVAVPDVVGGARGLIERRSGEAFDPIQSGQLMRVDVFARVGEFAEPYFIDAVDSEFRVRARAAGVRFVQVEGADLVHSLGELVPITIFGRQLVLGGRRRHVVYHSPFRTYYMVRNSIALARDHGKRNSGWMLRRTLKMTEMVVGCAVLAPDSTAQVRAIVAGVRDGLRRRGGRIPSGTLARITRARTGRA